MKEEVIAIGAYCPDDRRKQVLKELLVNLKMIRPEADLLVYSRTTLGLDIEQLVDHLIINKDNPILEDYQHKSVLFFSPNDIDRVGSSWANPRANTHLVALLNLDEPWRYCKHLGYKRFFYMEYDVVIQNTLVFEQATSLLNTGKYDMVHYLHREEYSFPFYGVNLKSNIPPISKELELIELEQALKTGKESERLGFNKFKSFYGERLFTTINNNDLVCVVDSTPVFEEVWGFFVIENPDKHWDDTNPLSIWVYNPSKTDTLSSNLEFRVNNQCILKVNEIWKPRWYQKYFTSFTSKDLNSLEIINNETTFSINFASPEERRKFAVKNYYVTD